MCFFFFFKQKTAYEMRISDWSSDVCSSDLVARDGLIEPLEIYLRKLLSVQPDARISQIEMAIIEKADFEDLPFPGRSAIRRRVHALRRLPTAKQDIGGIGAHLTIDKVHLDLSVKHGEIDRLVIIHLNIDRQPKLFWGYALIARTEESCEG